APSLFERLLHLFDEILAGREIAEIYKGRVSGVLHLPDDPFCPVPIFPTVTDEKVAHLISYSFHDRNNVAHGAILPEADALFPSLLHSSPNSPRRIQEKQGPSSFLR